MVQTPIIMKAATDVPARLHGGNAQEVEVKGLDYTLHLDIEKLPEAETTSTHHQWTPVWDQNRDVYERVNLNNVLLEVAAEQAGGASKVFDTKAAAEAATMPAATKTLILNGYTIAGDACQVLGCKRVNAMPTLHDGYIRTLDRFKADGTEDATNGGYWEYVIPSEGIRIEWFGGKCDTLNAPGTDNIPAYERAKKCVTNHQNTTNYKYYRGGPTILFGFASGPTSPSGDINAQAYYFAGTIMITDRAVHLKGIAEQGVEGNYGYPVHLKFAPNVRGFFIQGWTNVDGTLTAPGAYGSVLENLTCQAMPGGTNPEAHGVTMSCKATIRNCSFGSFPGHGVEISADVGAFAGNQASVWRMDNVWVSNNGRCGVRTFGGDANAGLGEAISAIGNQEWGIKDEAFLGNTWIGCHTRGNVLGPYKSGDLNARSVFLGCYAESDQPSSQITRSSLVLGGFHSSGIIGDAVRLVDDYMSGHRVLYAGSASGNRIQSYHATAPNHIIGASIDPTGVEGHSTLAFFPDTNVYGWYYGDPGFINGDFAFEITSEKGVDYGRGELTGPAEFCLPKGVFLGGPTNVGAHRLWYADKWVQQFIYGAGYLMQPGMYRDGDIELLTQDADTRRDYVGEYCTQAGAYTASVWTSGTVYNATGLGATYIKNSAGKFYRAMNAPGTPSTIEPTHGSGTVTTGDTYQWKWLANQPAIFRRFGNLLGAKVTSVNDPLTNLYQEWNNAAVAFQGYKTNITDTASAAASVLEEWQVNGVRKFAMGKQGGFGFFGATPPTAQPTVIGSRTSGAALASLLTALAATGIIIDGSSA